jgi:hypothetical protein
VEQVAPRELPHTSASSLLLEQSVNMVLLLSLLSGIFTAYLAVNNQPLPFHLCYII